MHKRAEMIKTCAVILAGGSGSRMESSTPKAFLKLNDLYILEYSILKFSENDYIHEIQLVVPKEYLMLTNEIISQKNYSKVKNIHKGGENRFESSQIGISLVKDPGSKILIHDAARPFISHSLINKVITELEDHEAVNVLLNINDSLVELDSGTIKQTVARENIKRVQTPQGFRKKTLLLAHDKAKDTPIEQITDDFNLVREHLDVKSSWVQGSALNFKITYAEDLLIAQGIAHHFRAID